MKPLEGIRVIELDDFVSAPVAGRVLSDMGAEVVKVERSTGNAWRETGISMGRQYFTHEENPVYDLYNSGKKHIALDLKTPEGLAVMNDLMATADVFLTNMRVKALQRLGLDEQTVRTKYPKMVYAIGLGYGEKGPDADQPAFDTSAFWARSGFLRDQGTRGEKYLPVCPPASVGDTFTGMTLACEICSALFQRTKTGEGQAVKSGLLHNACYAFGSMQARTQPPFDQVYPKTREEQGAPHGNYETSDGEWLYIASGYAERLIPAIIEMSGHPELKDDPRYMVGGGCPDRVRLTIELLETELKKRPIADWMELGKKYDIPMARLAHYADLPSDPQVIANGYLDEITYPNGHVEHIANTPIEMEMLDKAPTEPTPVIGRDTDEILKTVGFTDEKLAEYKEKGFIK